MMTIKIDFDAPDPASVIEAFVGHWPFGEEDKVRQALRDAVATGDPEYAAAAALRFAALFQELFLRSLARTAHTEGMAAVQRAKGAASEYGGVERKRAITADWQRNYVGFWRPIPKYRNSPPRNSFLRTRGIGRPMARRFLTERSSGT